MLLSVPRCSPLLSFGQRAVTGLLLRPLHPSFARPLSPMYPAPRSEQDKGWFRSAVSPRVARQTFGETTSTTEERTCQVHQQQSKLTSEDFQELHQEYRDRLHASLIGFVRDTEEAEDMAAWAFETA